MRASSSRSFRGIMEGLEGDFGRIQGCVTSDWRQSQSAELTLDGRSFGSLY